MRRTVRGKSSRMLIAGAALLALLTAPAIASAATAEGSFGVRAVSTEDGSISALRGLGNSTGGGSAAPGPEAKIAADIAVAQSYISGLTELKRSTGLPTVNGCLGPASQYAQVADNCPMGGQSAGGEDSAKLNESLRAIGTEDGVLTANPRASIMYVYGFYGNPHSVVYFLPPTVKSCGVDNVMSRSDWRTYGDAMSFQNDELTFCAISIP